MIYLLTVFLGLALFLLGVLLGFVSPFGVKKALKKKVATKTAQSFTENQKELQNFLNYDGSPLP